MEHSAHHAPSEYRRDFGRLGSVRTRSEVCLIWVANLVTTGNAAGDDPSFKHKKAAPFRTRPVKQKNKRRQRMKRDRSTLPAMPSSALRT